MFLSQKDNRSKTEAPHFVSKTQPKETDVQYLWNIVFHWNMENENPFSIHLKTIFADSEVPPTWYSFKLRDDLRMKKLFIHVLNGNYSIFCKVEKGKKKRIMFNKSLKGK